MQLLRSLVVAVFGFVVLILPPSRGLGERKVDIKAAISETNIRGLGSDGIRNIQDDYF